MYELATTYCEKYWHKKWGVKLRIYWKDNIQLAKMYQQKRKEVKEHNESIENGSKTQRVSQNQIRKYILKGESDLN